MVTEFYSHDKTPCMWGEYKCVCLWVYLSVCVYVCVYVCLCVYMFVCVFPMVVLFLRITLTMLKRITHPQCPLSVPAVPHQMLPVPPPPSPAIILGEFSVL